jgi:hypothetical protein
MLWGMTGTQIPRFEIKAVETRYGLTSLFRRAISVHYAEGNYECNYKDKLKPQ